MQFEGATLKAFEELCGKIITPPLEELGYTGSQCLEGNRMTFTVSLRSDPLRVHENGTVYVGSTRVMLELVIEAYKAGEPS
ncbi:MAG: hypothetical protein IPK17_19075 [Chloroflexi bacterium]|uniref:hypothetical protein n=1 Tax=Candidatus Flexifilum breve TaxID=3140694 RepID=UPI003134D09B|nr:hypothetical protein [Chloroflexota bacterium]